MSTHDRPGTPFSPSPEITPRNACSRRAALKRLGLFAGGIAAGATLEACNSLLPTAPAGNTAASITVDVSALASNGITLVTSDVGPDAAPIVVYRQSQGVFLAHSMMCTHAGCVLNAPSGGVMLCACHYSQFSVAGAVLRGPAYSPLTAYATSFDAATNRLTIKFK